METKEELMFSVELAKSLGFVPILLSGKVPIRPGWQKNNLQTCGTFKSARIGQNIGVLTGEPSGIIVLDIEKNELDIWKTELEKQGPLDKTLTIRTGGGGRHIYFKYDERVKHLRNAIKKPNHPFDLKTTGGQVVWINSKTELKYLPVEGYEEIKTGEETEIVIDLIPMPDWLIEILTTRQK